MHDFPSSTYAFVANQYTVMLIQAGFASANKETEETKGSSNLSIQYSINP